MRTTLDIADDVLQAAKELARRKGTTAGQVLSDLARQALTGTSAGPEQQARERRSAEFMGFRPFPRRGGLVTDEMVNAIRETEPD